jgi:hypothetical protein
MVMSHSDMPRYKNNTRIMRIQPCPVDRKEIDSTDPMIVNMEGNGNRDMSEWRAGQGFPCPCLFVDMNMLFYDVASGSGCDAERGKITVNVDPWDGMLWTWILPPSSSRSPFTIGSPKPVPVINRVFSFLTR